MSGEHLIVGGDFGQAESTVVWNEGGSGLKHYTIPSWVGTGDWAELQRISSGGGRERRAGYDELVISFDHQEYFVGQLAFEQSPDATTERNNPRRSLDGHVLKLLLATAGRCWPDDVSIRLIMGTPVSVWSQDHKLAVQQSLVGNYIYLFRGKKRRLTIDAVGVLMEGAAVLHDVAMQEVPQVVFDIGGGSFDIYYAIGRNPVYSKCDGWRIGVDTVGERISSAARALDGGRPLEPREIQALLLHGMNPRKHAPPPLFNRGQELHLNGAVEAAIELTGAQMVNHATTKLGKDQHAHVASETAYARLIGGGAYWFRKHFDRIVPHLVVPKDPERANADAYYRVGCAVSEAGWARSRGV